jgi:AraC-like DNA-binding protein
MMEEKLAPKTQSWISFLVEFPTMPKLSTDGREESQRILFLCPATELNPTELCLALFGRQIVMQRLQTGEALDSAERVRFAFIYAPEMPERPAHALHGFGNLGETVVLLATKANVVRSARCVTDLLAQPAAQPAARSLADAKPGIMTGEQVNLEGDESIWDDPLPDIVLVDDEGNLVHAAANLNDYRAEYACRYVLAHFHENVNRDKMADMVHLSPGYFSNLFRSEVGMSFSDYLIMVRIENAKAMLRRFELSVEAISKKCGFNSLAHFSRTFKDRCGLSPLKYRKSPHVTS